MIRVLYVSEPPPETLNGHEDCVDNLGRVLLTVLYSRLTAIHDESRPGPTQVSIQHQGHSSKHYWTLTHYVGLEVEGQDTVGDVDMTDNADSFTRIRGVELGALEHVRVIDVLKITGDTVSRCPQTPRSTCLLECPSSMGTA